MPLKDLYLLPGRLSSGFRRASSAELGDSEQMAAGLTGSDGLYGSGLYWSGRALVER